MDQSFSRSSAKVPSDFTNIPQMIETLLIDVLFQKTVSNPETPILRALDTGEILGWFSNRTGTSVDDGKAGGKD